MKLRITIEMDNAAFDDPDEPERILKQISRNWRLGLDYADGCPVKDINGNTCGTVKVTR